MMARAALRKYSALFNVFAIPSGLMGLAMSKALGIPSVVFVDAADTPGVESAMRSYVRYLDPVFELVFNRSAQVVVLEGLEDLAMPHIHHDRVVTIPNGATLPPVSARPGENGPRLELLSIGRLVLRKGFHEIIAALGIVKQKRDDFRLRIVGYGRAEDDIRSVLRTHGVEDHVVFLGRVEYKEIAPYYLASDGYLFYGAREGSSLAMIEAAAYGLPLIASDHPGNRTFVENGESGFLVEHRNPEALAGAILHLLEHKDRLAAMGKRSREIAEGYTWAKIAERYDHVLRRAIAG
jgi:glycosyltransferase involved in cell wall biosynthesis